MVATTSHIAMCRHTNLHGAIIQPWHRTGLPAPRAEYLAMALRSLRNLLLLLFAPLLLAAAGRGDVTVTVHDLPRMFMLDIASKAETAVVQAFLRKYPQVRLKRAAGLQIGGGSNTLDMIPLMQIAGDIAPDVLYVNFRMSDTYVASGFLQPLDEYVARIPAAEMARRVPPSIRDVCYRLGPDGRMHWYTLPTSRLVRVLSWRRDLFARAGLDPDRPPRTWDELEAFSRKLCDPSKNRFGMFFIKGDICSWDFANLVWSRGGDIVATDGKGHWRPLFNTPEAVDALAFYVRMTCRWFTAPDGKRYRGSALRDTYSDLTTRDDKAMMFSYLDNRMNIYQPEMIGFAPAPYPEGKGRSRSEINAAMVGLFAGVKDPEQARAAFDYMAFLDSDEANAIRVKVYIQNGFGKFVNPDLLERFGYRDYLKQADMEWLRVYKDALVNGRSEPHGKNCSVVYRELSKPVEEAINDPQALAALDRGDEAALHARLKQILDRAQAETARRMYGTMPPEMARSRTRMAWGFLVLAFSGFGAATFYLLRLFRREAPAPMPGAARRLMPALLLLPAVGTVALWQYTPLLRGTLIAFQDYSIMGDARFAGVANFSSVLFDPGFWHATGVTLLYTTLYMVFGFLSPIGLALLLSEVPRGKVFFRTIFYLPAVLSGLVVIFLWKSFYRPAGLLNALLGGLGIHVTANWLDSPALAMASVLLPIIWAGMGPGCLIYLAAFKIIPEELYEAAELEGAGMRAKVWHVTLPSIRMLIRINAIGAFIGAFMSSDMIFAMTGGGPYTPYGATEVVGLQLFYTAFLYLKFGLANAMAWVLGFMLLGFTLLQLKNLSRVQFRAGK